MTFNYDAFLEQPAENPFLNNFYRGKIEFNYDYKNNFVRSENFTFKLLKPKSL